MTCKHATRNLAPNHLICVLVFVAMNMLVITSCFKQHALNRCRCDWIIFGWHGTSDQYHLKQFLVTLSEHSLKPLSLWLDHFWVACNKWTIYFETIFGHIVGFFWEKRMNDMAPWHDVAPMYCELVWTHFSDAPWELNGMMPISTACFVKSSETMFQIAKKTNVSRPFFAKIVWQHASDKTTWTTYSRLTHVHLCCDVVWKYFLVT